MRTSSPGIDTNWQLTACCLRVDVVAVAWNQLADSEIIDGILAPMLLPA
jgi:hypothetical protein